MKRRNAMLISMRTCKQRLGLIWLVGSGLIFLIFLWQTVTGHHYSGIESEAWSWLTPTFIPTLTLMVSVWAVDAMGQSSQTKVDRFLYRVTKYLSIAYLSFILITILAAFMNTNTEMTPLEFLRMSHLWLVPVNSLTTAMLGVFFVKKPSEKEKV